MNTGLQGDPALQHSNLNFMPDNVFPEPAFFFRLIAGADEASFQEVSGLSPEVEIVSVQEGGEDQFHHRLPKALTHQNLKLSRGIMKDDGELMTWCKNVLQGELTKPIETKTVTVELVGSDAAQKPLTTWTLHGSYPVKWTFSELNAKGTDVAIETLELSCKTVERK
jgi:phage tail-like protein